MQTLIAFSVYLIVTALVSIIGAAIWDEGKMATENKIMRYSFYTIVFAINLFALGIFTVVARYINS